MDGDNGPLFPSREIGHLLVILFAITVILMVYSWYLNILRKEHRFGPSSSVH